MYAFKITDSSIPTRHGYEQAIFCNLKISGIGYTVQGEVKPIIDGEPIADIQGIGFQSTTDEETKQALNDAMCDCSKTVIDNVTALVRYHVLDILSKGKI